MSKLSRIVILVCHGRLTVTNCLVACFLSLATISSACDLLVVEKPSNHEINATTSPTPNLEMSDDELTKLIDSCWCRETSDPEFSRILSTPRTKLVNHLERSLTESGYKNAGKNVLPLKVTSRMIKYLFLLAWLGEGYKENSSRLVSVAKITIDEHLRGNAIGYLGVLIRKGDKTLLRDLFPIAVGTDAGSAVEILEIFRAELLHSTDSFLGHLGQEPERTQAAVFALVSNFDESTKRQIREKLRTAGGTNADLKDVADELLRSLS